MSDNELEDSIVELCKQLAENQVKIIQDIKDMKQILHDIETRQSNEDYRIGEL